MQCDILDYLLLFVDVTFGQRHILLCFQVKLGGESVTATLSLQRHRNKKKKKSVGNNKCGLYPMFKPKWMPRIALDNSETKDRRGEQVCDWTRCQPMAERRACGWGMKDFQRAGRDTAVNSNKCVLRPPPPLACDWRPTWTPGPPALIKGAVIAACQRGPQTPLLKKKCRGRWGEIKGAHRSCRNEGGSFQSTVKMQESFYAG